MKPQPIRQPELKIDAVSTRCSLCIPDGVLVPGNLPDVDIPEDCSICGIVMNNNFHSESTALLQQQQKEQYQYQRQQQPEQELPLPAMMFLGLRFRAHNHGRTPWLPNHHAWLVTCTWVP